MNIKNFFSIVAVSAVTTIGTIWGYGKYYSGQSSFGFENNAKLPANYASFHDDNPDFKGGTPVDFTAAAAAATPAVVHIKTKTKARTVSNGGQQRSNPFADLFGDNDMFGDIFGQRGPQVIPEQRASGSGVIISDDGYIVTNNHVIDGADEIMVTLPNKKTYKAALIGADASSDLAVLKIDGTNFPYMALGNSDDVKLGQWCLAIGYPLTLDVTVTAGIVSAKARTLGLNAAKSKSPVESYIQTDAAVNPGNSGGALVDTDGKLIGINSAIASPTGSYAGYSYAIPVNIVKKIANDLKKFGAVQRAYLGLSYAPDNVSDEQKKDMGIKDGVGVYVTGVANDGAAKDAGIAKGDFITAINGIKISSSSEMIEQIANYKPGDKISVGYNRDGAEKVTNVVLKKQSGSYDLADGSTNLNESLGGELETYPAPKAKAAGIAGGVLVKKINGGKLKSTRMQEGFLITGVNGVEVKSLEELKKALAATQGIIRLEGIYPGYEGNFTYPLNMSNTPGNDGSDQ